MKIKALAGFETLDHTPEEDEHGNHSLRAERIEMKMGDVRELREKLARRIIGHGHAEEVKDDAG
jgi:hypothetical protein